jgi:monoamine oxidase
MARIAPPGPSRRAFLSRALGAAGVLALGCGGPPPLTSGPPPAWARQRTFDRGLGSAVVVGAGLAGLACAWSLARGGVPTTVVEGSPRLGGRVDTYKGLFAGELRAELGGDVLSSRDAKIRGLIEELRLELEDVFVDGKPPIPTYEAGGKIVPQAEWIASLRRIAEPLHRDAAIVEAATVPHTAGGRFAEIDATSGAAWLKTAGCPSPVRELVEASLTAGLGLEPDRVSAAAMLGILAPTRKGEDGRFRVRGGNARLIEALKQQLPAIETGHRLLAVRREADGRLRLSFDGRAEVVAEHAVLAIPFTTLREVELDDSLGLDDKKKKAIAELGQGTASVLVVETISRPWLSSGSSGRVITTRPIQTASESSGGIHGLGGLLTVRCGGARGADFDKVKKEDVIADLDAVLPGIRDAASGRTAAAHWPGNPFARGSAAVHLVGQLAAFGGVEGAPAGNLHFAGEHTSPDAPRTMEGAVASGLRAAEAILASG